MSTPYIVINRRQNNTQSPSAYIGYFAEGEPPEEPPGNFALAESGQVWGPRIRVVYQNEDINMNNWKGKLLRLNNLKDGWNGYDAPAPSQPAMLLAFDFIDALTREHAEPSRLAPSAVGGVGIAHRKANRKVYVEFFNDGKIMAMFSDGASEPIVKPIEPGRKSFKQLISEMRDYIDA